METIKVHKLRYPDKQAALNDLKAKGIIQESADEITPEFIYGVGVHAVVDLGVITIENPEYDSEGNVIKSPVYAEGYHFDIMVEGDYDFGSNEIFPNNPKHNFF